jgi:hypothetical protein
MAWTEITRAKYRRDGLRYASDTSDGEWAVPLGGAAGSAALGADKRADLAWRTCLATVACTEVCEPAWAREFAAAAAIARGAPETGTGIATAASFAPTAAAIAWLDQNQPGWQAAHSGDGRPPPGGPSKPAPQGTTPADPCQTDPAAC